MKILTKEEEEAHYQATVKGGSLGGVIGLGLGLAGVYAASQRFHLIQHLTLPMKAFLVTSSGTFSAIISADRASRAYQRATHPEEQYQDEAARQRQQIESGKSAFERAKDWGRENRYTIVGASWVGSMATAFALVQRNKFLTTPQKIVQARVYAQGLTLAVLIATAAFEIGDKNQERGRWETVKVLDPNDPEHKRIIEKRIHHESYSGEDQWRDMVEAEERKIKEREEAARKLAAEHHKDDKPEPKKGSKKD